MRTKENINSTNKDDVILSDTVIMFLFADPPNHMFRFQCYEPPNGLNTHYSQALKLTTFSSQVPRNMNTKLLHTGAASMPPPTRRQVQWYRAVKKPVGLSKSIVDGSWRMSRLTDLVLPSCKGMFLTSLQIVFPYSPYDCFKFYCCLTGSPPRQTMKITHDNLRIYERIIWILGLISGLLKQMEVFEGTLKSFLVASII